MRSLDQISYNQNLLPAGFSGKTGELYMDGDVLMLSYNRKQVPFNEFPKEVLDIIHLDMESNPVAMRELIENFNLLDLESQTEKYLTCRHGKFDLHPDISEDGKFSPAEFTQCNVRSTCKSQGKLCSSYQLKHGNLNANEIVTLTHVGMGLLDKEIEAITGFSVHTIRNYKDNISRKSGLERKPALVGLAYMLGLVTFNP